MDKVVEISCQYYGFTVSGLHVDDYLPLMKEEGYFGDVPKISLGNHINRGIKYHVLPRHFLRIFLDWLLVQSICYTCRFYRYQVYEEENTIVEKWSPPQNQQHAVDDGYLDDCFSATPAWRPHSPDF